jgi:hypothetical protein
MKIGITLDEVLRNFISQFIYTYDKYIEKTDIEESDITNFDLLNFFKFENENKLNNFMYFEAPLEIFGHADQMSDGIMTHFNNFLMDMEYEGEHQIEIVSREIGKSIPATLFFLSKTGAKAKNIRFVDEYKEVWDNVDVVITANPKILESKPDDKLSIKVKSPYNGESKSDHEVNSLLDFIQSEDIRSKCLQKTITITFEKID